MKNNPKQTETLGGYILHNVPFPKKLTPKTLQLLKEMAPIQIEQVYQITYLHSYGQDSPFFAGLANKVLLGNQEPQTGYTYATPRGHDMYTGAETMWIELPKKGKVHAFTVCHFGSEEFLPETPFILALIEFEGVHTLLLTRLLGLNPDEASLDWIGMPVEAKFLRNSKFKPTDVYFVPTTS
ncbi:MAG: nucleotide-binding protein [Methanobacteriota archaeon]|nr:MAG: nucleotide-binding protein [Euryarchaeota archaeon]